ncbi:response regulator [Marispirochaeta sp.]|uniref:response regulator n=1 Tax=Marispirochaeta sp. TaxID=2038653 RepID=UPI0029C7AFC9|nr:response regulator [Marispirochaeta sp.]
MNGMEALNGLVAEFPVAKIVMVSAVGQKAQVFEALNVGAKDFIIKPFEPGPPYPAEVWRNLYAETIRLSKKV